MKVIAASAGTGKTTRLALEYLKRLDRHPPHRLAAVTFTRRAAAELKGRIYTALKTGKIEGGELPPKVLAERETYARQVLEAPIDTIHGFSGMVLRLAAPLLGLDPGLEVGDPGRLEGWFLEAARGVARTEGRALTEEEEGMLLALFKARVLAETFKPEGETSGELLELMNKTLSVYARRARRVLHPGDAERMAAKLVRHRPAVERVASRLTAVLVDEYQDTNPMQQALFEGLDAAGVEVVVVGDPKQSIFSFRNAVPEGFLAAVREGEKLDTLNESHRHHERLAAALNAYVEAQNKSGIPGFVGEGPVVGQGGGTFPPLVAVREIARPKGVGTDEARRLEARLGASIIEHWLKLGVPAREIMVLVQKRYQAQPLLAELRARGIPYAVQGGTDLYREPEVAELRHLLAFALAGYRMDRPALAALLTGPFVGMDPAEAAKAATSEDPGAWIQEHHPTTAEQLAEIRQTFKAHPAPRALSRLIEKRRYLEGLDPAIADSVLVALARLARFDDPGEALAALEALRVHGEEGLLATSEGEAVWVLTVHSAKGLQAECVLVFDAGREFSAKKPPLLVEPGSGRIAVEGEKAFEDLWKEEKNRRKHEWHRLLYVALSRAKSQLVVTGIANHRKDPDNTWLKLLKTPLASHFKAVFPEKIEETEKKIGAHPPTATPADSPAVYRASLPTSLPPAPPALESPSKAAGEHRLAEPDLEEGDATRRVRAQVVGTLVHAGIERGWRPEELEAVLPRERIYADLPNGEKDAVRAEVKRFLTTYHAMLADGRLVPLEERTLDRKELPAAFTLGNRTWYGVIDRLYEAGGELYLEDYKTDREPDPKLHLAQLALYREVVRRALGKTPKVRLVFLATGEVRELGDGELATALDELRASV